MRRNRPTTPVDERYVDLVDRPSRSVIAASVLVALAASALLWAGVGASTAPVRVDGGAAAPECAAERFRDIFPLTEGEDVVYTRTRSGLPTDPATRDRADAETERRGFENTFETGFTLTDEENAAFERVELHRQRLAPLQAFFEANRDVTAFVAFNIDVLDPLFTIQTLSTISAAQRAEVERLTPDDVPTAPATVEWSYDELFALLRAVGAGVRGEPADVDVVARIESVGLVPHDGGLGSEQFVMVLVDESDLGCDEQLTALVADAVSDLDIPPIVIEQSPRAGF